MEGEIRRRNGMKGTPKGVGKMRSVTDLLIIFHVFKQILDLYINCLFYKNNQFKKFFFY